MPSDGEVGQCTEIADQAFTSFNARRENEWKVRISIWTLIIVTTRLVLQNELKTRERMSS